MNLVTYGLAGLVLSLLAWAYWTTLGAMAYKWWNDPQYSQGYLVPVVAMVLLFLKRDAIGKVKAAPDAWGLLLVIAGLGLHVLCGRFSIDWVDGISLILVIAGLTWLCAGLAVLRYTWPAILFLVFMVPLPYAVETSVANPLQRVATLGSSYLLQTLGIPAVTQGNIIFLSDSRIGVVEACSGLSMLLIFCALATAIVIIYQPSILDRVVLLLFAVPIAVIVNILRITATGIAQERYGTEAAEKIFHDWAGWLMMPAACGLIALELWLMRILFPRTKQP